MATLRAADDAVYATLDANADRLTGLLSDALTDAGVPHRISRAGNMFSVFFTDGPVTDFATAKASETWRYPAFFHALLDAGVYPPCSAFETWFVSAALDDDAFDRIAAALPGAARAAAEAQPGMTDKTIVHVMRHGEVHNPDKILYGRLPDYHLSERGGRRRRRSPTGWRTATSPTSSPRRWSARRRPPPRSRSGTACRSTPTTN